MEESVVRAGDTLGAWGPGAPDPAKTEIADYDLSTISVAAKPRTAVVINITVVAGMCPRNSAISFPAASSQCQQNSATGTDSSVVQKMMAYRKI
jgi:hypothetical protein